MIPKYLAFLKSPEFRPNFAAVCSAYKIPTKEVKTYVPEIKCIKTK